MKIIKYSPMSRFSGVQRTTPILFRIWLVTAALGLGCSALQAAAPDDPATNSPAIKQPEVSAPAPAGSTGQGHPDAVAAAPAALSSAATNTAATTNEAPAITAEYGAGGLRLNFRGAPLSLVLDYLSDAAGFVINKLTDVRGTVEVWSKEPVTKDEAVALLSSVLKKNGYALTRNGRILTILEQGTVKTANLDITIPYSPDEIETSDEVVTAIIHVRYANAQQLMSNLEVLLPTTATLTANESANTLLLVATKTDVKRMLRIINALDTSIASVSNIKVMPLKYADAKETATMITQLFTSQSGNQPGSGGVGGRGALFSMFAGGFGRTSRDSGGGGGSGSPSGAAATRVVAVGDDRSNSVVVSAPADLLMTISEMVEKIDQPITDETELRVFRLVYADPTETADQLAQLFPDPTAPNSGQNNPPMPFFSRFSRRSGDSPSAAGTSERAKKLSKVIAVPDPRTSSLLVTASKSLMPQIAEMIAELDSNPGHRDVVKVFELRNADPQDVNNVLQELFQNRSGYPQASSSSRSGMLGNNNPLTQRSTQQIQQNTTTPGFGTGSSFGGAGRSGGY